MDLLYKENWDECKNRYKAWWEHEYIGRALVSITASDNKGVPFPEIPKEIDERWTNPDYIKKVNEYVFSNTYYGGDSFPIWNHGYPGWEFLPVFLGSRVILDEATGWVYPCMEKGSLSSYKLKDIRVDKEMKWYKKSIELLDFAIENSKNKAIPTIGAFGASGDTLASLRSTEQLLYDLMDEPESVTELELHLMDLWIEFFDWRYKKLTEENDGMTCWFSLWAPGKFYAMQNDFAYMISPEHFKRCFLPAILKQSEYLDYMVYHVDGIGNFSHIDTLLMIDKLQAIQVLPGSGKPSPLYYKDELIKIQKAGKNLHIDIPCSEIPDALDILSARGLHISTYAGSKREADDMMTYVEEYSVNRW